MKTGPKRKPTKIKQMNTCEIGWVAGIIEGEGNIRLTNYNQLQIRVGMTDLDIVERLQTVTGVGNISIKKDRYYKGKLQKPLYSWAVSTHNDVVHLLVSIVPLLGKRRRIQVEEMLNLYKGVI